MLFPILLILKILLFINTTNIEYNKWLTFATSTLIVLLIFNVISLIKNRKKDVIGLIVYTAISAVMFIDVMYYSYFNLLPSIKFISLLKEATAVGESVKDLFTLNNALFILDIPFLIFYTIKSTKKEVKAFSKKLKLSSISFLGFAIIGLMFFFSNNDLMVTIASQELFTYHIKDIKDTLIKEEPALGRSFITEEDIYELKERSKLIEGEYTGIGKDKNLIVIQIEALQNFPINRYYNGQEITPNLNRLIEENGTLYFNNYYQQIGRGNTSDAEFVTNNSLYPTSEESIYKAYADNTFYGLPWILRDNGYTSWVFHGYEKEFWNRANAYVNQGFQRFISEEDFEFTEEEISGFGIVDEVFYEQTLEYMDELNSIDDNPFHAFIISLTSHTPFNMPERFQYLDIDEELEGTILGNYIQAVHYADMALGQFIEGLKEKGYYDNSVIAIYGDHFAITGLNDSGVELMTDFMGKPYDLDEMMKIPLIIHIPNLDANETISKLGSQLDFLPTILNIMGYENEKGIMFGRDLINYEGKTFVAPITYVIKGSFIDDDYIFYMARDGIFNNSTAKKKDTYEKVEDISILRDTYELVIDEINKSNYILKTNLIDTLLKNDGNLNLNDITPDNVVDEKYILKCYDEPIKQLTEAAESENRIMSVLIKWADDAVVLSDGTPIEELVQWIKDHEGVYISLRSNEEDESIFMNINSNYPEIMDRLIVEMAEFEHHIRLSNKAYKHIMLKLSHKEFKEEDVLEFLNRTQLNGVIIKPNSVSAEFIERIQGMNIPVYIEEEDKMTLFE